MRLSSISPTLALKPGLLPACPPPGPQLIPFSFRRKLKVLVPGAGLGRLAYDVAKMGMVQICLLLFSSLYV
jgi:hypothetical protein